MFKFWVRHGCFDKIFEASVLQLFESKMLDLSVLHGDGTSTSAKKGDITKLLVHRKSFAQQFPGLFERCI
jgi:hypothetical protein